jgi:3-isopropylmalate/(R)-2-methylmalate dehydratase large subunit
MYRGVCHVTLAEEGFTVPGEVMFGTDSHTCTAGAFGEFATGIGNTDAAFILGTGKLWVKVPETLRFVFDGSLPPYVMAKDMILRIIGDIGVDGATYKAMEFDGEGIYGLGMEERMTVCNMAIEAGGKNGIIAPDEHAVDFVKSRTRQPFDIVKSDPNAVYAALPKYRSKDLEHLVARPFSPANVAPARTLKDVRPDQCYIGSCTGGKIHDFIAAAKILKGKTVKTKTVIVPATTRVEQALFTEHLDGQSLWSIFEGAGAEIGPPSCAACLGGPGHIRKAQREGKSALSTTNRNFPARMGSMESQTYLASPMTVAASAVAGRICDPRDVM